MVTGQLGGSILGHHLRFIPRLDESLTIRTRYTLHAGLDISDGLTLDLARMTLASGCGAEIDLSEVPVSEAAHQLALADGKSALEHALSDGEDFELLLAVPPGGCRENAPRASHRGRSDGHRSVHRTARFVAATS
jgi:thiamine-monophosphate kinase